MLSGRRTLVRARVAAAGEVIELNREQPAGARADRRRAQRDPHAGLHPPPGRADRERDRRRRARRIDAFAGTLRIKEFLTRNGHPYAYIDLDRDADVAGAARSISRRRGGRAGADLSRRDRCCAIRPISRSPTASASTTPSTRRTSATSSSSAPARPAWRRRCTARRKDSMSWCWSRTRRAGRPDRARRIENYLGFPTGISGPGARGARLHAGAEVRRPGAHRQRRHAADLRSEAVRGRDRRTGRPCPRAR